VLSVYLQNILVIGAPQQIIDVDTNKACVLKYLLFCLFADHSQWTIQLGLVSSNNELEYVWPWAKWHCLKGFVVQNGLHGSQGLILLGLVVYHVTELWLHGFNRKNIDSLLHLGNVFQAILPIILMLVDLVLGASACLEVIDNSPDLILYLALVNLYSITKIGRYYYMIENVINLKPPWLFILSGRFRRIR
jgi:hypothetical protein